MIGLLVYGIVAVFSIIEAFVLSLVAPTIAAENFWIVLQVVYIGHCLLVIAVLCLQVFLDKERTA
jgi:hypothetical protein